MILADLHIHSKYSRGCSNKITLDQLSYYGKLKGLNLIGTGDFTHPLWFNEIKQYHEEDGIIRVNDVNFIYQTEINLVYSQDAKVRRIHLVILAPERSKVQEINEFLSKKGNLKADGRPTFGNYKADELVEDLRSIDNAIEIIPAHIWTPWFGIFGSKSGFDSLQEAFQDQKKHIHAIETGLSSDPLMNWRIKELHNISIISSSDAHSFWPWRIGREATFFNIANDTLSYDAIVKAIRQRKVYATVEVDPSYGKYHYDGHRNCNISLHPKEAMKLNNICPVCNKPLTLGVLHRVEQLADYDEEKVKRMEFEAKKPYYTLLPLAELIANALNKRLEAKEVKEKYFKLISKFGSEMNILLNASIEEIRKVFNNQMFIDMLMLNRKGKLPVVPGYDGVYGKIDKEKIKEILKGSLMRFI